MNMFNILTKLASIAGTENTNTLKEWGGDPAELDAPKSLPDSDPDEANAQQEEVWNDMVRDLVKDHDIKIPSDEDAIYSLADKIEKHLSGGEYSSPDVEFIANVLTKMGHSDQQSSDAFQSMMGGSAADLTGNLKIREESKGTDDMDLSMESLRVLAGMNNTLKECGVASAMGNNHPASINITAGSGSELTGMLKDIMGLAGVSKPEVHTMPLDATAGPAIVAAPAGPSLQDMLSKIDGIEAEPEVDGMNDIESDDEEELTDEASAGGFDQATTEPHPQHGPDGVRQFGDMNTGDHGDRMDGTAPRGHVKKESVESFIDSLYQDYQSFIAEGKVNEVSRGTLKSYTDKAFNYLGNQPGPTPSSKDIKRLKGIGSAANKLKQKDQEDAKAARQKIAKDARDSEHEVKEAKKPSAGMTSKEKSAVVKKAKAGKDIGKAGKGFEKVEKAAKAGGAKDPKAVAAAAMWKQQAKK